ncbi:MAG: hypothetical protein CM1200mP27_08660 [Chloroflexota bacterium]|nr:MAG: hypothetical protein CM1200mP27_08660 [Chloroflexota bacterium]
MFLILKGIAVAAEIAEAGGMHLCHLDVTDESEWEAAVQSAITSFGKLDILVNNAGIGGEDSDGDFVGTMGRHYGRQCKGGLFGTKAAIPEMRKAGGGSIVNISSTAGLVGAKPALLTVLRRSGTKFSANRLQSSTLPKG